MQWPAILELRGKSRCARAATETGPRSGYAIQALESRKRCAQTYSIRSSPPKASGRARAKGCPLPIPSSCRNTTARLRLKQRWEPALHLLSGYPLARVLSKAAMRFRQFPLIARLASTGPGTVGHFPEFASAASSAGAASERCDVFEPFFLLGKGMIGGGAVMLRSIAAWAANSSGGN